MRVKVKKHRFTRLGTGTRAKTIEDRARIFDQKKRDGRILGYGKVRERGKVKDLDGCC